MTIGSVLMLFVWIVGIAALAWLAWWVASQFSPPPPVARIVYVAIVVVAVILIILVIFQATGVGFGTRVGETTWFAPSATDRDILNITSPALNVMDRA